MPPRCAVAKRSSSRPESARAIERGLLVDLLVHEVVVALAVELLDRPVDVERAALVRGRVERRRAVAVGVEHGELAVLEVDDVAGVAHERRDVGGDEHLVLADADDDGRARARGDDRVRLQGVDHDEPVGALDAGERRAHGVLQREARAVALLERLADQLGDALGVGLGGEDDARRARARRAGRRCSRRCRCARPRRVRSRRAGGARSPRSARRAWPSACGRCRSCRRSASAARPRARAACPARRTVRSSPDGEITAMPAES